MSVENVRQENMSAPGGDEKWREDFPTDWESDRYVTRREFTKFLIAISGVVAAGNGLIALQKMRPRVETTTRVAIGPAAGIPVGGVKLFHYPTKDHPAIAIRLSENEYAGYIQACTHLSCPVTFSTRTGRIECPCHGGSFEAATGKVLAGPPPRPLPKIALAVENGVLYATGFEGV